MNEPLLYTYGMLFLNTYKKLWFSAGSTYYHNGIIIGLVQMEQQGIIKIEWNEVDLPVDEDERLHIHARVKQESVESAFIKRIKNLPEDSQEFQFLYDRIPADQPISLINLFHQDYKREINSEVTEMQALIEEGLVENNMAALEEQKRFFGKSRTVLVTQPESVQRTATHIREILQSVQQQKKQPSEEEFILLYLIKIERMLPKLFDKQEAKRLYDEIEVLSKTEPYCSGTFLRLTNLVRFLEETVFLTFTMADE